MERDAPGFFEPPGLLVPEIPGQLRFPLLGSGLATQSEEAQIIRGFEENGSADKL